MKAFETVCEQLGHLTADDVQNKEEDGDGDGGNIDSSLWVAHKKPLSDTRVRTCPNDHMLKRHVTAKDGWQCACCKFTYQMHQASDTSTHPCLAMQSP